MNDQRKVIFEQRIDVMQGEEVAETISDMRHNVIHEAVTKFIPENAYAEQWKATELRAKLREIIALDLPIDEWAKEEGIADEEIRERVVKAADDLYEAKRSRYGAEVMVQVEKAILLQTLDHLWREHIIMVDHLRQVVGLRGYGQRDPLNEYKTEGFNLFEAMIARLRELTTGQLMRVEMASRQDEDLLPSADDLPPLEMHHADPVTGEDEMAAAAAKQGAKISRNDPCPCGSGKKYKHCHGALA